MVPVGLTRLGLLLVYLALLFLLVRVIEALAWYEAGFLATQIIDPFSLSVRKLKYLLDGRGVSYGGVVEKKELTSLVQTSGDIYEGELELLEQEEKNSDAQTTQFSCGVHFYEEVEDKKDSVWMVQITPYGHAPLLPETTWSVLTRKVARFGIRTGKFDCALDYRFCHRRGWSRSSLILAMPQGNRHKDQVSMVTYTSSNHRDSYILAWVNRQLSSKINTISNMQEAIDYTTPTDSSYPDKHPVMVSLFSTDTDIPLFYSAVSMKFTGRIKFGHMKVRNKRFAKKLGLDLKLPAYMIKTPEGLVHYGYDKGQYLKYNVLDLYLRTLYPEANDLLLLCFTIVNSVCVLELFLTPGGVAKRLCCFLWVVGKYNLGLLIVWLPLLGLFQFSLMNPIWRLGLKLARVLSQTAFMSQLRNDWIVYSSYSNWLIGSYFAYCLLVGWIKSWRQGPIPESDISSWAWLKETTHQFYNFLLRPSPPFYRQPVNNPVLEDMDGLDIWIERMATPDLWLHDIIPTDYIKDLPTWKYSGVQNNYFEGKDTKEKTSKNGAKYVSTLSALSEMDKIKKNPICSWCKGVKSPDFNIFKEKANTELFESKTKLPERNNLATNSNQFEMKGASYQRDSCHNPYSSEDPDKSVGEPANLQSDKTFSERYPYDITTSINQNEVINDLPKSIEDIPICKCHETVTKSPDNDKSKVKVNRVGDLWHDESKVKVATVGDPWPDTMLPCTQCAICLDCYNPEVTLCGLPCGHSYHHQCILLWLKSGKHQCPHCRWPAFKSKKPKLSKHME